MSEARRDNVQAGRAEREIGVALVGYGLAGSAFHAPFLTTTPGLEVRAVVTGDPDRGAAARERCPAARILDRAQVAFGLDDVDVAVLATPNRTHVPLAREALEAGLHVVVDKPLAATAADARDLVEEARRRNRLLTVYQNRRWDADFLTLRHLLDTGRLGDVHRFESRFERWRPEPKPGWRQDPDPEAAGGLLYDLGPHLIDQALVLFGPVRHVHAEVDQRRPGTSVTDDVFLALHHESGVRSHLWMNATSAAPGPRFRVLGSRAAWVKRGMDPQEAALRSGTLPTAAGFGEESKARWGTLHEGGSARTTPSERGSYGAFYVRLRDAILEGGTPPVDPAGAVAALEIMEVAQTRGAEGT